MGAEIVPDQVDPAALVESGMQRGLELVYVRPDAFCHEIADERHLGVEVSRQTIGRWLGRPVRVTWVKAAPYP